ncbi:hypothetical protein AHF37_07538 [Paragonimus kellicotti]|nr:hypothetical protein AHF37_07538 [Paragonimus kellicotti]
MWWLHGWCQSGCVTGYLVDILLLVTSKVWRLYALYGASELLALANGFFNNKLQRIHLTLIYIGLTYSLVAFSQLKWITLINWVECLFQFVNWCR